MSKLSSRTASGTFFIAGTTIGAGMLGLPLFTSETNVFAMIIITVIAWFVMYVTGLYLMEATLNRPSGANFLSLAQDFLPRGREGGCVTGVFVLIFFFTSCLFIWRQLDHINTIPIS